MDEKKAAENNMIDALDELREAQKTTAKLYDEECEATWNALSKEEQMKMFYSVVKRIYKGEIIDNGTYRWVLYEVFGFGPEAYGIGMECGYLYLHNAIVDGEAPKSVMYKSKDDGEV